jgi:hypothetical protein
LHGHVTNKDSHDRLLQMIERMVRNSDSRYYGGADYPGKQAVSATAAPSANGDEQSHAPEPAAGPVSNGETSPPAR